VADSPATCCSERERDAAESTVPADEVCLAWLLERRLFELGGVRV
jgi:hypothetical protein